MSNLWDDFKRRFKRQHARVPPASNWPDPTSGLAQSMPRLIRRLDLTQEVEYSCDDVLRLLDQFAEAFLRGEDVQRLMPLVYQHLELCADCREEYEALLKVLRTAGA